MEDTDTAPDITPNADAGAATTASTGRNLSPADQPTRRRMTLNLSTDDYAKLERLAAVESVTIHDAIRRSVATRWRIFTAPRPAMAYPHLPPDQLPAPAHLALVDDLTGEQTRLEIL